MKIGVDFDGVVAYNPFRILRSPISWFKRNVLKTKKTSFFVPKNDLGRLAWNIIHKSSVFPAQGTTLLSQMAQGKKVEFHLVTGRYSYLKTDVSKWLCKYNLDKSFKTVNINEKAEQPHEFKLSKIKSLGLDYFIEDNLDIVRYLEGKTKAEVFWIYNLLDKNYKFRNKFPYLEAALKRIEK